MDASMMQISYPASRRGVAMARIPRGAVASMLEKDATKNTIFFDDFTAVPFVVYEQNYRSNARSEIQTVATGSPAFVSELSKLCKIQSTGHVCLSIHFRASFVTKP